MFQAGWAKPLKVHRGLGNSYIPNCSLMKCWQSSSAQPLDTIWQAEFWATLPQTGPKLGRPRDRNSSWGVTNRFLSSDLCSAMDSAQVDWQKNTLQSESHTNSTINATEVPEIHRCGEGQQFRVFIFGSFHPHWVLCQRVEAFVLTQLPVAIQVQLLCPAQGDNQSMNHESWAVHDFTDTYQKMISCFPWQLIFFDHCRVRLWSDQQVDRFDITLAVLGKQHELCNLLEGKILSLKQLYVGVQHSEAFWNQRLLHFKKFLCIKFASSRQWPSHALRIPSNAVVTVAPTREAKHLRSQPQNTFHQNQTKWVYSHWSSISTISLRRWPCFLDLLAATLQLPLFEKSWSVGCDAKTKTQQASFASLIKTRHILMDIHGTSHHCFGAKWMHLCSLDVLEPLHEPHPQVQKWEQVKSMVSHT